MKITVYSIDKKGKNELYKPLIQHYQKLAKPFAKVEIVDIFTKEIQKAQEQSAKLAQKSYSKAFTPFIKSGYNIALDLKGKEVESIEFAKLLQKEAHIAFFIAGAYGFERDFVEKKCNLSVSLGKITYSHKLAKVVLLEQIYRALTILNNHPYHK